MPTTTMKQLAVYTTVDTEEAAQGLARSIIEQHLAACAQITRIDSVYWWEGQVQQSPEYRLLFKTTESRYAALAQAIKHQHPYELPALYAVPFDRCDEAFADWINAQSQP